MSDDRRRQLLGVLLLFLGLLVGVSLASHVYFTLSSDLRPDIWATQLGLQNRLVANWMFDLLGFCAWLVPVLLVMWGCNRVAGHEPSPLVLKSAFLVANSILLVTLIYLLGGRSMSGVSGLLGAFVADWGTRHIGKAGTLIAGLASMVVVTFLTTEIHLGGIADWAGDLRDRAGGRLESLKKSARSSAESRLSAREERAAARADARRPARDGTRENRKGTRGLSKPRRADGKKEAPRVEERARPKPPKIIPPSAIRSVQAAPRQSKAHRGFKLPTLALLDDPPQASRGGVSRDELLARSRLLEEKLADFDVSARVTQVHPGPIITRFEMEPARGVKVSQIVNLQDDLALALKATSVRIVAPIPGKGAVGIELPNERPSPVYLKEVLADEAYRKLKSEIPLVLGVDTTGRPFCADLAKMPHLLVAGATGSGKSVCLNSLIAGMTFRSTPREVRFLLIDPKRLELPRYKGIPHLMSPVITEAKHAALALQWLVSEMDRRYELLSAITVRDLYGFNRRIDEGEDLAGLAPEDRERLPHIVVVVDEFADLMLRAPREVEAPVQRLAQMARAVGIHLVFATQRPSVDVITGVIKANFASRIAFRVISMTDSRTVLDRNGAQTLLGSGDMLFLPTGSPDPIRLHGAYTSSEETARLVSYLRSQGKPDYVFDPKSDKASAGLAAMSEDAFYAQALEIVVGTQMGSTSLLQRRLSVGYARAGRLMDSLEANGIVGPFKGSKAREVLVGPESLDALLAGGMVATSTAVAVAEEDEEEASFGEDPSAEDDEEDEEDDSQEEEDEDDEEEDEEDEGDEEDDDEEEAEEEDD